MVTPACSGEDSKEKVQPFVQHPTELHLLTKQKHTDMLCGDWGRGHADQRMPHDGEGVGTSAFHPSSPGAHVTVSLGDTFSTLSCLATKSPPIGASTDSLCQPQFSGFPRGPGHHLSKARESPKPREQLSLTLTGPSSSRVQSVFCQGLGTVNF